MDTTQSIMTQCVIAILWNGELGSLVLTFLKLRLHPWKSSSMAETGKYALGALPYAPQQFESGLRTRAVLLHGPLGQLAQTMSPVSSTEERM